jgi:hypothetical protein
MTSTMRRSSHLQRAMSALGMVLTLSLCVVSAASAEDFAWSGGGPGAAWSTAGNWQGGTAPPPSSTIGTLTFPLRPSQTNTDNDLSGLSINYMQVDDSHNDLIGGQAFTLGSGGLSVNATEGSEAQLGFDSPIILGASQTWTVAGPPGTPPAFSWSQSVGFSEPLTGESADLTINLNSHTLLRLGIEAPNVPVIDDELGNLTINGVETTIGNESGYRSFVVLGAAKLNASDGHRLTLNGVDWQSETATGPIIANNSVLSLAGSETGPLSAVSSRIEPFGTVNLPSLSLDAGSTLWLQVGGNSQSQLSSSGPIALDGQLVLDGDGNIQNEACHPPSVGQVSTLVSTTGPLSGSFANAPNGSTVTTSECAVPGPTGEGSFGIYSYRVDYDTASSPKTVTATALPTVPVIGEAPTIGGSAVQGQTLSQATGYWANRPGSIVYQWQRCDVSGNNCQAIAGATSPTYVLTVPDIGSTIRLRETASNAEGTGTPATSPASAVIQAGPGGGQAIGTSPAGNTSAGTTSSSTSPGIGSTPATSALTPAQLQASLGQQLAPSSKAAKIGALLKNGGLSLPFTALEPGTISVGWYLLPQGARLAKKTKAKPVLVAYGRLTFAAAVTGKLNIRLSTAGKRLLTHAKRLKLVAKGTFTPPGGAPVVAIEGFTLSRGSK